MRQVRDGIVVEATDTGLVAADTAVVEGHYVLSPRRFEREVTR